MKIITMYTGHNSTVSYFEDGSCQYIFHEEKFNNIKNYSGFPEQALQYLASKININEVDNVVFTDRLYHANISSVGEAHAIERMSHTKMKQLYYYLGYVTGWKIFDTFLNWVVIKRIGPKNWKHIEIYFKDKYSISSEKLLKTDHHTNHALAPFYFYGLPDKGKDCLILTMDGGGDLASSKIFVFDAKKGSIKKIAESPCWASLGFLFNGITRFLGMKANEHAYKVMGLAAYVNDEKYYKAMYDQLKKIVWLNEDTLEFDAKFYTDSSDYYFKKHFVCQRFDNVAASAQHFLEDLVILWIKAAIKKTGIRNIAVGGGVFMNVKMNQRILELPEVDKVYFQPSCGDESNVIGAAASTFRKKNIPLKSIKSMYFGHRYTNEEVKQFLQDNGYTEKYTVEYYDDIEIKIAEMLSQFKIVARFKGPCEYGARSLCNRAILGNASDLKTFYEVNDMIKMRDFWMPFAPTILDTWADKYIIEWNKWKEKAEESSKYMIITYNATELARNHLRAAIHQKDKTLRPQVVSHEDNSDLYRLLTHYEKLTGMGGVMNTSLNIHGYPLVGTLEQAMFTLDNSGLEYIALENWLVTKKRTN